MSKGQGRSGARPAVNTSNSRGPYTYRNDQDGLPDNNGGYAGALPKNWSKTTTGRDGTAWKPSKEGQG